MKENPTSYLQWMLDALGLNYCLLLVLAGVCGFVMTLLMVRRGKGDKPSIGILLCIGLPLLVGLQATVSGMIKGMISIATHATGESNQEDMARVIAISLFPLLLGILLMIPGYLVATIGLFRRSIRGESETVSTSAE